MGRFEVFVIRLLLSTLLAVLIGRFFFDPMTAFKVAGLTLVMLALAYIFEYLRQRDEGEKSGG
jgi:maltodextrin utilization protein YvdJ